MNGDGVYFRVGLEDGEGFAELVTEDANTPGEFDGAGAAQMLSALIGQFMNSSIDPLAFQSAVMGILATADAPEANGDVQ